MFFGIRNIEKGPVILKIIKRLQNYYSFSYIKLSKHLFIRSANKSIVVSGNYLAYGSGRIVFLTADGCIQHVLPPVKCDTACRCQEMVLYLFYIAVILNK